MTIKFIVLKSGEQLISDIKEMAVGEEDDQKVVGYFLHRPCIVKMKNPGVIDQEKRGYKAVQLGYGKIKNSKLTKAMKGFFAKKNTEAKKKIKEYRVTNTEN